MAYPVRRCGNVDITSLRPSPQQKHRDSSIEAQERVRWEHEPLLLVALYSENEQPEVERRQSRREQGVGASLAWLRLDLGFAQAAIVEFVGYR